MREIVFRGKRTNTGKWTNTRKWAYGGFTFDAADNPRITEKDKSGIGLVFHTVIPETVGQYTGIEDKNSVRIFEGDILTFDDDKKLHVCYADGAFWLKNDIGELFLMGNTILYINNNPNVIGNIHDNPELLEMEK